MLAAKSFGVLLACLLYAGTAFAGGTNEVTAITPDQFGIVADKIITDPEAFSSAETLASGGEDRGSSGEEQTKDPHS